DIVNLITELGIFIPLLILFPSVKGTALPILVGIFFYGERAYCGNLRRSLRMIKSLAIAVVIPFLFFLLRPPTPPHNERTDD
ncbi:hypothetical protein, partial [Klebsiella oxytoca]|uniref:hypothetical protein n=1 Tax=Klebsiella oxytoca TaxID=571 RepID=UPI001D0E2923